ncbi:Hypothetical protein R9X50_00385200 [Acrodontium crateriforme]|uniref:Uncharacterized protein n=1 Tax=Acrodontium crateriforme TaxID=150365 RepID=A0AAQ3RC82_9PEZI|nr:Hypothetical protein R9X50_00385200 [Acrodontium crateriforme]
MMDHEQVAATSPIKTRKHALNPVDITESNAPPEGTQVTPPESPTTPPQNPDNADSPALFHNYFRALHSFNPVVNLVDSEEAALMTATIKPGDLVLVHSIHANGWADGTILNTGERGWLPTNYCEPYSHPYLRNLLTALTLFWDLMGSNEEVTLATFVRQDYIRGLIAGVRCLLEHANCLHRHAALVQNHIPIRKMRKALLADLSGLVLIAKSLQDTAKEPFSGEVIDVLLYDLITKAFKVVTRAVSFVDVWMKETAYAKKLRDKKSSEYSFQPNRSTTPPSAADTFSAKKSLSSVVDDKLSASDAPRAHDQDVANTKIIHEPSISLKGSQNSNILLAAVGRRKGSVAHRMSCMASESKTGGSLASKQLAISHDNCVTHIRSFVGHRLNGRPTSGFIGSAERVKAACEAMLAIVDEVYANDTQGSMAVYEAREILRSKLDELVRSTKDVFKFSDLDDDDTGVVLFPNQSSRLVHVGANLMRTAGDCFAKTRSLIEQIGDFELERSPTSRGDEKLDGPESGIGARGASPQKSFTTQRRTSQKLLPSHPPPLKSVVRAPTEAIDFAIVSNGISDNIGQNLTCQPGSRKSQPQFPMERRTVLQASQIHRTSDERKRQSQSSRTNSAGPARKDSVGISIAGSMDTLHSDERDSAMTALSETSTRATTPEQYKLSQTQDFGLSKAFASLSNTQSVINDVDREAETQLLQKTYANELVLNRDGQVTGGSLEALVEQLTVHDAAPDPQFLSAFYVTFRMFTLPRTFAKALEDRFDYIGDSRSVGQPVRLRVYNVFKGWLETHWDAETDADALADIRNFANHKLKAHLPSAGERLFELTRRVSGDDQLGTISGPLVSGVGKTSMSITSEYDIGISIPDAVVSKGQLTLLRNSINSGGSCSITDIDPLETARQLTLLASRVFCDIKSYELLGLEWTKKNSDRAPNVRRMCGLNTDLAHVVGDTILAPAPEDNKRRALLIKHWSKIAMACLELNNYDSLVAIMCSLNSSVVQRLKKTWSSVSKNTRARIDELNKVVDISKNQASLRSKLDAPVAPCLPFLGMYLTDLTFVDAGNLDTRELPGGVSANGEFSSVINFDKYMRTAKIISHLQRFQVPYRLQPVPEIQTWMEAHMVRMRASNDIMVGTLHRRSLIVEPKMDLKLGKVVETPCTDSVGRDERPRTAASQTGRSQSESTVREKFGTFFKYNSFSFKKDTGSVET